MRRVSGPHDGRRLGRGAAFAVLACANVVMMATASAPSPTYPLYRERWGLSVTMLTVIFAVYVVGLLGALLTVGSLSDQLGRRPVLVAALLVAATSTAIFWTADGVVPLLTARVVQGIATGTATGGLAAGLVELSPKRRPQLGPTTTAVGTSIGMAAGAGVVGLLVQSTSRPEAYVFPVLTLTFVVLAAVVLTIPETLVPRAMGLASLRPRVRVPRDVRPELFASIPALVAAWSTHRRSHGPGKRTSRRTVPLLSAPHPPRRHHPQSSLIRTYGCRVGAGRLASAELSLKIPRSK
ncbi:MFS transporter [Streptomyces sp. NPDC003710]